MAGSFPGLEIDLALHLKARLLGIDVPSLDNDPRVQGVYRKISFHRIEWTDGQNRSVECGRCIEDWFSWLLDDGVTSVKLHNTFQSPETNWRSTNFFLAGANQWLIKTIHPRHSRYWFSTRFAGSESDGPIWASRFEEIQGNWSQKIPPDPSLEEATLNVRQALIEAMQFSEDAGLPNLNYACKVFGEAIKTLDANDMDVSSERPAHLPMGVIPKAAERLLRATNIPYLFGGMGSWPDNVVSDENLAERHAQVSDNLYGSIGKAVSAAINSAPH